MFGRRRRKRFKDNLVNVSELANELARDKRFRKRLLSAVEHGAEARRRARAGLGLRGAVGRLAGDRELLAELRAARRDLQHAFARAEGKQRKRRLRKLTLVAALASLASLPQVRERLGAALRKARSVPLPAVPGRRARLEDLTKEELYARAQEADIAGRSEMSKEELIEALRGRS